MSPVTVKYLHISFVAMSFILFFVRGIWMLQTSSMLQQRWVKLLPHIIDTALLASAITLAIQLSLSPLANPWLMAKIIALLLYIVLGTIAIKRGKTKNIRLIAWLLALAVFIYMLLVAKTHQPWPL
jgi:uncharacterized membrane protein SirB2